MATLSQAEIERELATLPGWEFAANSLQKEYQFNAYMDGVQFAAKVAELAEEMNHHPDLGVGYRKVRVATSSHDAGGVTERDVRLARRIDSLPRGAGLAI